MLEALILGAWVALFGLGYAIRSYVGTLIPGAALLWAAIVYAENTPTDDEIGALYALLLIASLIGVMVYLGGVALGRRRGSVLRTARDFFRRSLDPPSRRGRP
jgi:hypothetical protein